MSHTERSEKRGIQVQSVLGEQSKNIEKKEKRNHFVRVERSFIHCSFRSR